MTTPDQLHSLLRRTLLKPLTSMTSQAAHDRRSSPRLCVLLSGRHGVGTTSLAVNLAVALADQGARVVLVDADVRRAQVARLCGVSSQAGIDDIQHARRDIHEVLVRGPAGLLILPATDGPFASPSPSPPPSDDDQIKTHLRLIRQLRSLDRHADIVLLDLGYGPSAAMRRYWESADDAVLVTTPDAPAVLDTYATVKGLLAGAAAPPLRLLVNRASVDEARDVHRRFDQSCNRFLGIGVEYAGSVPLDESMTAAARRNRPLILTQPGGPAAVAISEIAKGWQMAPERTLATTAGSRGAGGVRTDPGKFSSKSVSRPTSNVW